MSALFINLKPIMTVDLFDGGLLSVHTAAGKEVYLSCRHCNPDRMLAAISKAFHPQVLSKEDLMPCADCGIYTIGGEYYMVRDDVWERASKQRKFRFDFLCIECLENRLGRTLTYDDFTDCPLNDLDFPLRWRRSERLLHRLTTRSRQAWVTEAARCSALEELASPCSRNI